MKQTEQTVDTGVETVDVAQIPGTATEGVALSGAEGDDAGGEGGESDPDSDLVVAGADVAGADVAVVAAKAPSKAAICEAIFLDMAGKGNTRQEILAKFVEKGQMTEKGAATYYATFKSKHKIAGVRTPRETKPTTAKTVTTKDGSSTVIGSAKTGKTKPGAGNAQAPFSVAIVDNQGIVTDVKPYFSPMIAQAGLADLQKGGQVGHVVNGLAVVGQPITMYQSPAIASQ